MNPFSLSEKRVLVVGGSSGIGRSVARLATDLGASVAIASRSPERLAAAKAETGAVAALSLDARDEAAVRSFFDENGAFDHVVVSAADFVASPLRTSSLADAHEAMDSKFWSAVNVARAARIETGGSLCFVSGVLSRRPAGGATLLSSINAAVEVLAQALALEMAPVRVNCVSPGRIDTDWWRQLPAADRQTLLERTAAALPVKRVGTPNDVALQTVVFMVNDYMTGSVVAVDGGASIA